jgi:hypothetical protein
MESISSSDDSIIAVFLSFIKTGNNGFLTMILLNRFIEPNVSINSWVVLTMMEIGILDYLYYEYSQPLLLFFFYQFLLVF